MISAVSLRLLLREGRQPSLVVLDTMGRWLSGQYLDYNGYGDMNAATLAILTLAADLGQHDTSTLVSHHGGKSHKAGAEAGIGSQALGGHLRQRYQSENQGEAVRAEGDIHPGAQ